MGTSCATTPAVGLSPRWGLAVSMAKLPHAQRLCVCAPVWLPHKRCEDRASGASAPWSERMGRCCRAGFLAKRAAHFAHKKKLEAKEEERLRKKAERLRDQHEIVPGWFCSAGGGGSAAAAPDPYPDPDPLCTAGSEQESADARPLSMTSPTTASSRKRKQRTAAGQGSCGGAENSKKKRPRPAAVTAAASSRARPRATARARAVPKRKPRTDNRYNGSVASRDNNHEKEHDSTVKALDAQGDTERSGCNLRARAAWHPPALPVLPEARRPPPLPEVEPCGLTYDRERVEGRHHGNHTMKPIPEPAALAYHVIIVGAGVAGLSAARKLVSEADVLLGQDHQRHKLVVTILEGRDRVGGRIHTYLMGTEGHNDNDHGNHGNKGSCDSPQRQQLHPRQVPVDLGASFVHGCNKFNPVWQLAQDLNISLDTSEGGYSEGWGRGAPWLKRGGKRIGIDKIHRVYALYKDITAEVDRIAAREAQQASKSANGSTTGGLNDNLGRAVAEARQVLREKFSKANSMFENDEAKQVLESINVLWAGYCSRLEDSSLAMAVDENWDVPVEHEAIAATLPEQQSGGLDDQIEHDARLAKSIQDMERRHSSRRSKLPSVAVEENERDESDGLVVGGYGPFLIVRC